MELELLIGGRRIPLPEFPPPFPPFPAAGGNLLPSIPTVPFPVHPGDAAFHGFPPPKLRPVRGNPSEVRNDNPVGLLQQQRPPSAADAIELEGTFDKLGVLVNEVCGDGGEYFPVPPDEVDCASVLRSIANGGGEAQCSPEDGSPGEGSGSGSGRQNVEGNHSEGGVLEDESSSSSSDDEEGSSADTKKGLSRKRKRETRERIEHFIESLVMEVMEKQEQMHAQLIERLERREQDRIMREEAWRKEEMERNKREEAARERETARNLALVSFIHNALGSDGDIKPPEQHTAILPYRANDASFTTPSDDKGRWSEAEINALITLRIPIEPKFRIVGPKCSYLWDGISAGMRNLGFNRSGKKCREKWENMNHYYKRSVENRGKKGFNSSKVPYFNELKLLHESEGFNSSVASNQTTREENAGVDVIENQLGS